MQLGIYTRNDFATLYPSMTHIHSSPTVETIEVTQIDNSENLFYYTLNFNNGRHFYASASYISQNGAQRYYIFNLYNQPIFVRIPQYV
jgi:hypothetical protein